MRTKRIFSALVGAFGLCFAMQAHAQDPLLQITNPGNSSLDYMPVTDDYLLSGNVAPPTVGGMSNIAAYGWRLSRIQLQVIDNSTMSTSMYKTYATLAEVMDVQQMRCSSLSVSFYQSDAKQTSDGGYILCGFVLRNFETTSCPGPGYCNPYLIKTDAAGNVMWYKRYDAGVPSSARFYSVVEDPGTHNIVVCGVVTPGIGILPTGFIMGTDAFGNTIWAYTNYTTTYNDPTTPQCSSYSEVTPYVDNMGRNLLVLTGSVGYSFYYGYGINTGGGFLTTIDGMGTILKNVYITEDGYGRFMQLQGVHDAHDGEVVLTGFSGASNCGVHDGFNLLITKVNPLAPATPPTFMNVYQTNALYMYDVSFGSSITTSQGALTNKIAVAGYENIGVGSTPDNAIYAETDYMGNLLRYTQHTPANAGDGMGVVYNTTNMHTAYSGSFANGTFLLNDSHGSSLSCDPVVPAPATALLRNTWPNNAVPTPVMVLPDMLVQYNMADPESIACGHLRPASNTVPDEAVAVVSTLTLSPNPAGDYVDVALTNALTNGTIKVYDMTGKLLLTRTGDASHYRLDISSFANGAYMLTAENNGTKEHATFVKQ